MFVCLCCYYLFIKEMAFACQRSSYLKELISKVVSCVKVKDGFEVILNDTVLFPEGGGQVPSYFYLKLF